MFKICNLNWENGNNKQRRDSEAMKSQPKLKLSIKNPIKTISSNTTTKFSTHFNLFNNRDDIMRLLLIQLWSAIILVTEKEPHVWYQGLLIFS